MQQLINITTDGQGSSVVSARELYHFLEVKQQFADWIKSRIIKYGFREGEDYVEAPKNLDAGIVSENSEKPADEGISRNFHKTMKDNRRGPQATDYAMTLDMAKELSMVERNQKGKEARLYFIDCERAALELAKQLATAPPPSAAIAPATEQLLLQLMQQQTQLMAGQQAMLDQLRADVEQIRQTGQRPPSRAKRLAASAPTPPHLTGPASLRQQIVRKVNEYCARHGVEHSDAYKYLYRRLWLDFGFNVHTYRLDSERPLDTIERYGKLVQLLSIIDSELAFTDE